MPVLNKKLEKQLLSSLKQSLIASCQPVDNGPMDKVEHVVAMALAAIDGGAKGVRIEGVENVRAVAKTTSTPIVGIVKRDLTDSPIRITPFIDDVKALAQAGASIIAFDGTDRKRPTAMLDLLDAIHQHGCIAMADCADYETGLMLAKHGCTFIGSTLSGYIDLAHTPNEPDYPLVSLWAEQGINVIAEGRYNSPERAAKAIELGAFSVTVGSAITRVEHITQWFVGSIDNAVSSTTENTTT
ncbi:N-acetylmannosamine-6-phosphate 2-epimerase [Shewanella sp. D64]|uniref:N-acetylmannosamine-6-phosphate 2-epimerase n=1 Tax=unclassified Shewanella TaxID=196818 RepID=UPI0022BA52ED|nr:MULTISPECIES: N-acetylmannosamine-6-phosphate 2-epimerase [unclassified Shewanella]MEC4726651.1 N-acetylmannosamine-6-phosphate 2-epimerase [Shewanella sp. D64]MEC4738985.1 N-acetylmannosamine-6-phosphate 2-epimerase [Shewanella sp. E94]WBJ96867.1 N-acetylmannosamine-6-phosphate 2-epimerase [Shewanella sp. MTB7]